MVNLSNYLLVIIFARVYLREPTSSKKNNDLPIKYYDSEKVCLRLSLVARSMVFSLMASLTTSTILTSKWSSLTSI